MLIKKKRDRIEHEEKQNRIDTPGKARQKAAKYDKSYQERYDQIKWDK